MSPEREISNLASHCHDRQGLIRVGQGNDSTVYKSGDKVVKVYDKLALISGDELELVKKYKEITNLAAILAEQENWTINFAKRGEFKLKVNIYDSVDKCEEHDVCVGVMPYIPGDPMTQRGFIWDLDSQLKETSIFLKFRLNSEGINLAAINIKDIGNKTLMVTDLCSHLVRL
ncbi:MAG TPA: hypothetical protein VKC53_00080 [Patescibacteria group bacterium]|nr:hypothetical protein [Patescibacteria group bacterium]